MIHCPKCDGQNISGPHYRPAEDLRGAECLLYRCLRCGYEETTPCMDFIKEVTKIKDIIKNER